MTSSEVWEVWNGIEQRLATLVPRFGVALRPPATEESLCALEAVIDRRLPTDVRAYLAIRDGQDYLNDRLPAGEILSTHRLLPAAEIERQWRFWYEEADADFGERYPGVSMDRRFLELTESDGDSLLVDLASGEVYFHVRAEGVFGPLAPSWREWLVDFTKRLDDGRIVIEDAGTSDASISIDDYNPALVSKRFPRIDEYET